MVESPKPEKLWKHSFFFAVLCLAALVLAAAAVGGGYLVWFRHIHETPPPPDVSHIRPLLKNGDVIVAFDNQKVDASNAYAVMDSLQVGRRFNTVSLTYERGGSRKTVSVVRGLARTVSSSVLGKTGYVRITGFFGRPFASVSSRSCAAK